ncbi:Alpha-ketoglutarate-dependent sulfonate dioxygenase [Candida viswanathii]|uniref:Alpha-ketoglutarate-dependent sulfonate dioxygenase n=1 Tax=Candida viswanathii TaxID=5486 RepID=A0A367XXV2_9ASCO|nr:Alpha-ketoglutarate-dependent sulfonate dioxygenase [Candida viswanathii]
MSPTAATTTNDQEDLQQTIQKLASLKPLGHARLTNGVITGFDPEWAAKVPESTKQRFEKYGVDISQGYPYIPVNEKVPKFVDEAYAIRNEEYPYVERGKNADPEKKLLFDAAEDVIELTPYIGTEIVGLQLADLTEQQKDELALLIAERVVVFFRDQDLSPQKQLELGHYWGQVEVHPQAARVGPEFDGNTVIWHDYFRGRYGRGVEFRVPNSNWHLDLVHEYQSAGITHLHLDAIPDNGADTLWSSTYGAYDKLSPALQQFLDGKTAIYRSAHQYLDRENPLKGPKYVEREHPIVRTHPATGWKYLFVNRAMTVRIVGLLPAESDLILNYLYAVIETNRDIQVRWKWDTSLGSVKHKKDETEKNVYRGVSALWDNRVSNHSVVFSRESIVGRHGTRVTSLADTGYFDPNSKSQREALGLSLE